MINPAIVVIFFSATFTSIRDAVIAIDIFVKTIKSFLFFTFSTNFSAINHEVVPSLSKNIPDTINTIAKMSSHETFNPKNNSGIMIDSRE
jgi:hypothetical protein